MGTDERLRVVWLQQAQTDLVEAVTYVRQQDPDAAFRLYDAVREQVGRLGDFPSLGRAGRVDGTRELVIAGTPYITAYRVTDDEVQVLAFLHGAKRWPSRF